jgi:hypothetical protein
MKLKLSPVFLLFAAVLFFSSCEKEYSFENGGTPGSGAAEFTLGGSPASCTGFVTAGVYTAGTGLIANNTVTFDVTVTTIGSYAISTAAVNGVTFSKTGDFTTTGAQTITLDGTGTPTAAGDFVYTVTNGSTNNCSYTITVVPAGPVATGTLDCAGVTTAGTYTQGIALTSANTVTIPVAVATAGSYSITTTVNGATFSGAGVLTAGAQTIVLTGSGTPANAGATSYPVVFGSGNCSFSIDFLPGTSPSTDYIRCKIDGADKTFNEGAAAVDIFGTLIINGLESSAANAGNFTLTLSNLLTMTIAPGTYTNTSITNTCMAAYIPDISGTAAFGSATAGQSGAFTVIVTSIDATRVQGTFSGTFYDNSGNGTGTKVVTNGEFSVPK